ncbi:MAG: ThiF family adenylyltransferase [Candidatus Binatia bacterium]
MKVWWLSDFQRLERERRSIDELEQEEPWLHDSRWVIDKLDLCVQATIEAGTARYPVSLRYPAFFPATPPAVWPQDPSGPRWSGHQYGSGGELCLEWGLDNWHPDVTGADMLRSTYRLLSAENPLGGGTGTEVPSRHRTTLGQNLRGVLHRLVLTRGAAVGLRRLGSGAEAGLRVLFHRTSLVAILESLEGGGSRWADPQIPKALELVDWSWRALVIRVSAEARGVRPQSLAEVREILAAAGQDPAQLDHMDEKGWYRLVAVLLVDGEGKAALVWISDRGKGHVARCEAVVVDVGQDEARLGAEAFAMRAKRVGIVGLGSAGSKIALMLVRSGVRKFLLVDDDIFLPENVVRHTLDWRNVGEHKVDGVAFQLELVAPEVEVEVERRQLTGQESTSRMAAALGKLGSCDLIVDAAACGRTFGLLAMVARQSETGLVWLQVFAGGRGGLVGRYRPGRDPDPFVIRGKVWSFLNEQQAPKLKSAGPYVAAETGQESLIASDADVTVISSHAARLALDALGGSEPSAFPQSVYLVGLRRAWIFDAPFHTIPIDIGEAGEGEKREGGSAPSRETLDFLQEVVERSARGGDSSSS